MMKFRFKYDHWLPKKLRVSAITLYPYVFYAKPWDKVSNRLMRHELEHVAQVYEYGPVSFYLSYLCYSLAGFIRYWSFGMAYRKNPYEIEANDREYDAVLNKHLDMVHRDHHKDLKQ